MKGEIVRADMSGLQPSDTTGDLLERLGTFLRLNVAEGDASEHTIRAYQMHIVQFVEWCEDENVHPALATEDDVALYRRHLAQEYARNSIAVKLSAVRRFYEAAMWRGYRNDNPAAGLKPPRDHTTTRDRILDRYLSPEEIERLLKAPDGETKARDLAMIGLMYYHGLRVSEIVALRIADVVLSGDPRLNVVNAKGGKSRVLMLIDITIAQLGSWMTARQEVAPDSDPESPLFVSYSHNGKGSALTTDGVRYVVNGYLQDIGIYRPGLSCHALRHAHASHVAAAGGDITALSSEMGHASPETTMVYRHVVDAIRENPASVLANANWKEWRDGK